MSVRLAVRNEEDNHWWVLSKILQITTGHSNSDFETSRRGLWLVLAEDVVTAINMSGGHHLDRSQDCCENVVLGFDFARTSPHT